MPKFSKLPMCPVIEQDLFLEFGSTGSNDRIKIVTIAKLLQFWIIRGIEMKTPGIFIFHKWQGLDDLNFRGFAGDYEG
jgi:hypothetical protein